MSAPPLQKPLRHPPGPPPLAYPGQGFHWVWCQYGHHWHKDTGSVRFDKSRETAACSLHAADWDALRRKRREARLREQVQYTGRGRRQADSLQWEPDDYKHYVFDSHSWGLQGPANMYSDLTGRMGIEASLVSADRECTHGATHEGNSPAECKCWDGTTYKRGNR